ncbi:MAG: DUF4340 domain-containing protein [Candidatus Krumholzibacteria bacterium]|nr:DUF4340 domain-containing protein [Candidatus Krumholzibacteria bacterium]
MKETTRTLVFTGAAVLLALLALVTAPKKTTPNAFTDQGEPFFPQFTDPNAASTLEVIDFDEETGSAVPFKVTFKNGRWSIPSHHDYPADGKDRLAKTAAGVIGVEKDDFRSDNVSDHEACGVIDPVDETAVGVEGRGQRVTIKGENDIVLADFIVGNAIEGREGFRFLRVPGQKRVYAARADIDISTKFRDWIESDLLQVDKNDIEELTIKDYTVNERMGTLNERDVLTLRKQGDEWIANRMRDNQEVDKTKLDEFLKTLDELAIEGVRPKPSGLSASLEQYSDSLKLSTADMMSLQGKGFFFTRDGRLVSNEGELQARTGEGIIYTLRFGEIVYGSGLAVSSGSVSDESGAQQPGENRYLFITTQFDPSRHPEPERPPNTYFQNRPDSLWTEEDKHNKALHDAHSKWQTKHSERNRISDDLNARFASWYYVISAGSFDKLRQTRSDLVSEKKS